MIATNHRRKVHKISMVKSHPPRSCLINVASENKMSIFTQFHFLYIQSIFSEFTGNSVYSFITLFSFSLVRTLRAYRTNSFITLLMTSWPSPHVARLNEVSVTGLWKHLHHSAVRRYDVVCGAGREQRRQTRRFEAPRRNDANRSAVGRKYLART